MNRFAYAIQTFSRLVAEKNYELCYFYNCMNKNSFLCPTFLTRLNKADGIVSIIRQTHYLAAFYLQKKTLACVKSDAFNSLTTYWYF